MSYIEIKGACENNLKNISLQIPKNKLVVFTGLSGSGKSTLALDTLQRECQRQYMESLGQITEFISKPKVESITGLSPSISIDQHNNNRSSRSTVGTVTEVYTYLRILFSKLGVRNCPKCNAPIHQSFEMNSPDAITLESQVDDGKEDTIAIEAFESTVVCPTCAKKIPELTMSHFSFNKPEGACPKCKGLGVVNTPNLDQLFNREQSIRDGAIYGWDKMYTDRYSESIENAGQHYGFSISTREPIKSYGKVQMDFFLYGALSKQFSKHFPDIAPPKTVPLGRYEGFITNLERRYGEKSGKAKEKMDSLFHHSTCPECDGVRLRSESIGVTVNGINIIDLSKKSLGDVLVWVNQIGLSVSLEAVKIALPVIDDLKQRLKRLLDVGLGYLSLDRSAPTLSPGEAQRLRLASILGSGLTGVLYVLDEPTTGLHARDTEKLINVLLKLRDLGNTVLVIEHDTEVMKKADHIIDFGPGAGKEGGTIVAAGSPLEIASVPDSLTGQYLFSIPKMRSFTRRSGNGSNISIFGAKRNNLKNVDVQFPLGMLVSVTGVSGSGKSTMLFDVLGLAAQKHLKSNSLETASRTTGLEQIADVITIDQTSIGRSSRSNPATYTDVFSHIRDLYAGLKDSKKNKLQAKHFSFNVSGGRCEKCEGQGELAISMHFLPDVQVKCPVCHGDRFQKNILEIKYKGYSISDVLNLSIAEAFVVFRDIEPIAEKLAVLNQVGLGYLGLGQSSATLSGGEAQRIKLSKELGKRTKGHTLYLLDEPTTGLHPHDVQKLMALLDELVDQGNTVMMVEHNLDAIAWSDWIIDFGAEGGDDGGRIIAQGTPEAISQNEASQTGAFLQI